jgi:hypothetical protein
LRPSPADSHILGSEPVYAARRRALAFGRQPGYDGRRCLEGIGPYERDSVICRPVDGNPGPTVFPGPSSIPGLTGSLWRFSLFSRGCVSFSASAFCGYRPPAQNSVHFSLRFLGHPQHGGAERRVRHLGVDHPRLMSS